MVFTQLSHTEKDAFFGLLDEYFASRPELLNSVKNGSPAGMERAAASVVQRAISSPAGRAGAQDAARSIVGATWQQRRDPEPSPAEEDNAPPVGRVAAAAAALRSTSRFASPSPAPSSGGPPRPPPRRASSTADSGPDNSSPPPPIPGSRPGETTTKNLVSIKKFGSDVDTSSGMAMFNSLRHSSANKSAAHPQPTLPPAFPQKKNQFAPPPTRRLESHGSEDSSPPPSARSPAPPPPPRQRVEEEEEPAGEWAEVVYDYSGQDADDLNIKEGQMVLIVEKSSPDWWTGELDGKRGLVPASYLKLV